jgi:hypothetical protein
VKYFNLTTFKFLRKLGCYNSVPESDCQLEWYSMNSWAWSVLTVWVGLLVREVRAKPWSHVGDDAVEQMLAVACCCCRVMLVIALPRRRWPWRCWVDVGCGMTSLLSRTDNGRVTLLPNCASDETCTCKTKKLMREETIHVTIFYLCRYSLYEYNK